jgi:hypothetical protein
MHFSPDYRTITFNVTLIHLVNVHLPNQPVTLAEMGLALIRIWNNIPQAFFNNLVRSMRRRCQAYINANGGILLNNAFFTKPSDQ